MFRGIILLLFIGLTTLSVCGDGLALYKQGATLFKSDPVQALKLFEQAAEAGNVSAMVGAGHCYETGTGAAIDYAQAIRFYDLAVKQNSLKACEGLARIYASCPEPAFHDGEKAVKYASVLTRKNARSSEMLSLLAAAYSRNFDFKTAQQSQLKAIRYATEGQVEEMRKRMLQYKEGKPVPPIATDRWIFKAAGLGIPWALYKAGVLSQEKQEEELAVVWYTKAVAAGSVDAAIVLGDGHTLYKHGLRLFKSDPVQALKLFEQAAEGGNVSAMVGAGHCYETGMGTKIDYARAIDWYEEAITMQKSAKAYRGLVNIYASCELPEFHNGERAVLLAQMLLEMNPMDGERLALSAAALARNIQFEQAIRVGMKAMSRADSIDLVKEYRQRYELLQRGVPIPAKATEQWVLNAVKKDVLWAMLQYIRNIADVSSPDYAPQKALVICEKVIREGEREAYLILGDLYLYDLGKYQNLDKAYENYVLASESGFFSNKNRRPIRVLERRYLLASREVCFEEAENARKGETRTAQVFSHYEYITMPTGFSGSTTIERSVYKMKTVVIRPNPKRADFLYLIATIKGHPLAARYVKPRTKGAGSVPTK
ncbi:MAG: tetratricopeptide repeat protein [Pontiella sp.]